MLVAVIFARTYATDVKAFDCMYQCLRERVAARRTATVATGPL